VRSFFGVILSTEATEKFRLAPKDLFEEVFFSVRSVFSVYFPLKRIMNSQTSISLPRLLLKTALLLLVINFGFAACNPLPWLGSLSAYNFLYPGRLRLPYGEHPEEAYNFSLSNLEAMAASHEIAGGAKPAGEYRVVILGDSSVWGYLLRPEQTLSARINARALRSSDGRTIRAYNFGYPTLSLLKDMLLMQYALRYQPDLIVWCTTLESFPVEKQASSPLVQENLETAITIDPALSAAQSSASALTDIWQRSLGGRRRELADLARLQAYGILWAATGIDQYYPAQFDPPENDLVADDAFHEQHPPQLNGTVLAWGMLEHGISMAGNTPILFVNEPIYLASGKNSDLRYNFFYPRWAFDQFRENFAARARTQGWRYFDAWDLVPPAEFSNSAIHLSPAGEDRFAEQIARAIQQIGNPPADS
jgi:hypothetical protein